MGVQVFTDLLIWRRAREWQKQIYPHTQKAPFSKDRRLVDQINGSAPSVMANIAEGFGRGTQSEFMTFLGYAIGSLNETQSHLCVAYDREHISRDDFGRYFAAGTAIRKMTVKFITSMILPGSGVKNLRKHVSFTEQVWELYERLSGKSRPELTVAALASSNSRH